MYIGRVYNIGDTVGKSQAIYLREAGKTDTKKPMRLIRCKCSVIGCTNEFIAREDNLYYGRRAGVCDEHRGLHRHYALGDSVGTNGATYVQDIKMCEGVRYIECVCANPDCNHTFIAPESQLHNGVYKGYCEHCRFVFSGINGRKKRIVGLPISDEPNAPIFLEYVTVRNKLQGRFLCGDCKEHTFVRDLDAVEGKRKEWFCNYCNHIYSKGERIIANILDNLKIKYIRQYHFDDLRGKQLQYLKFDFYLPEYDCCIEYDGEQHFIYRGAFGTSYEEYLEGLERDKSKDEYCSSHGIKLIRIPYTILEKQELDEQYILDNLLGNTKGE